MKKKTIAICVVIVGIVLGLLFKDCFIRTYVSVCNDKLESYATKMLEKDERTSDKYGVWKTVSSPEEGLVEFWTGGFGLAPSSTYKGFYYSADDKHKPFSVAYKDAVSMEIDGDSATWTDGTDNNGISNRIIENWFWFEASF